MEVVFVMTIERKQNRIFTRFLKHERRALVDRRRKAQTFLEPNNLILKH